MNRTLKTVIILFMALLMSAVAIPLLGKMYGQMAGAVILGFLFNHFVRLIMNDYSETTKDK